MLKFPLCFGNGAGVRNFIVSDNFAGIVGSLVGGNDSPPYVYGNVSLSANATYTFATTGFLTFAATSGTQTFTTKNKTWPAQIEKTGAGTLRLEDDLTMGSGRTFTHTLGTLNLNGRILTTGFYSSNNSNLRTLQFGAGQIVVNDVGTVWNMNGSNMTITPGTGKITLSSTSATARTFAGGSVQTYPELVIGGATGASTLTITGTNRFKKLTNAKTVAYTIVFPNANTSFDEWALDGTEGNLITMTRTGGSGEFTADYKGGRYIVAKYISISNSLFLPTGRGYAVFSTNGGGNNGWVFGAPKFGNFLSFFDPA
jgi:hypothetical protein